MRHRKMRSARRLDERRHFRPAGPNRPSNDINIGLDEFEAMRLCDLDGHNQIEAAEAMHVSRATVQRLLESGRQKLVLAVLTNQSFYIDNSIQHIKLRGENNMGTETKAVSVVAIPTSDRATVDQHFGHTKEFALYVVKNGQIEDVNYITPPKHEPGVLPQFLAAEGAHVIITGGMGQKAITLFKQNNIDVILGAEGSIDKNMNDYLKGVLESFGNGCDH